MDETAQDLIITRDAGVTTLTLNRPQLGNAVSPEMAPTIIDLFRSAAYDPGLRCILIRGEGPNLSAGGDLGNFKRMLDHSPAERGAQFDQRLAATADLVTAMLQAPCPIVTVHRGATAGAGLLFTLAADMVFADDTASFLFAHQKFGMPPDGGVSLLLPPIVGWRAAKRLVLTAARVDADEAVALGLLEGLHPADAVEAAARKQAEAFARAPRWAVSHAKRLFNTSLLAGAEHQLSEERRGIVEAVQTEDFAEGVNAFLEKRRPLYPSAQD